MLYPTGRPRVMGFQSKDETVLRKYLLGDMSADNQDEFELWLMSDNEAYDLLEAAEDDLIDDAVSGRLQGRELDQFNNHFLLAPERRRKLQFGRSFRRLLVAKKPVAIQAPTVWDRMLDALRYRPAFGYALCALIIVSVIGIGWSILKVASLEQQLNATAAQLKNLGQERDGLKGQLDETQSANATLETQLRELEAAVGTSQSSTTPPTLLALNLIPGLTRSSNDLPKITITSNNKLAQFSLSLLDDNYTAYRAALIDAGGQEIWSRDKLPATTTREGKAVVVTIPTEVFSTANYSFNLMGVPDSGTPESVASFYFRAVRQ